MGERDGGGVPAGGGEKINIKVGGMTCVVCAKAIEKALSSIGGVTGASVNLGSEKAEVTYNPGMASPSDMRKAIEDAGYTYLGVEGEETGDLEAQVRARDLREKLQRVIVGFVVGIPLMILMFFPMAAMHGILPYVMLVVAAPVFSYISYPIFAAAQRRFEEQEPQHGRHVRHGYRRLLRG